MLVALNQTDIINEQTAIDRFETFDLKDKGIELRHRTESIWSEFDAVLFPLRTNLVERYFVDDHPVVGITLHNYEKFGFFWGIREFTAAFEIKKEASNFIFPKWDAVSCLEVEVTGEVLAFDRCEILEYQLHHILVAASLAIVAGRDLRGCFFDGGFIGKCPELVVGLFGFNQLDMGCARVVTTFQRH